jgi:hypothetical protein
MRSSPGISAQYPFADFSPWDNLWARGFDPLQGLDPSGPDVVLQPRLDKF